MPESPCLCSSYRLQKGGVPAAPSGTATLLRLSPSHRFRSRARLAATHFKRPQLPWLDGRCVQGPGTYSPYILEFLSMTINYFTIPFSRYSSRLVRTCSEARSTATFFISASTIILTRLSKEVFSGFHPNRVFAFVGSPHKFTT